MPILSADTNTADQNDGLQDLGVPVPVQTFLWRQIAPFIRPKLGKLHEASCMVCNSSFIIGFITMTIQSIILFYLNGRMLRPLSLYYSNYEFFKDT